MTLAKRIDKTMHDWDPYGYRDSECSVEFFENLLRRHPEVIIAGLLDMIDELLEEIEDYKKGENNGE